MKWGVKLEKKDKDSPKEKVFIVRFSTDEKSKLKQLARIGGTTMSGVIHQLIEQAHASTIGDNTAELKRADGKSKTARSSK